MFSLSHNAVQELKKKKKNAIFDLRGQGLPCLGLYHSYQSLLGGK